MIKGKFFILYLRETSLKVAIYLNIETGKVLSQLNKINSCLIAVDFSKNCIKILVFISLTYCDYKIHGKKIF